MKQGKKTTITYRGLLFLILFLSLISMTCFIFQTHADTELPYGVGVYLTQKGTSNVDVVIEDPTQPEKETVPEPIPEEKPEKEEPTTQPSPEKPVPDSPKTGDSNHLWLYIGFGIIAVISSSVILYYLARKEDLN